MARVALVAILIAYFVNTSVQISRPEDDSYVAAVVEYQRPATTSIALEEYERFIKEAAEQNADIVAFPEMTFVRGSEYLTVPVYDDLQWYQNPSQRPDLYEDILVAISKAARDNQIYVVINVQERMDCTNNATAEYCPEAKVYMFNTNVVFDRSGAVIDRYRKIKLFGEAPRSPALTTDLGIFDTDFGVRFGHFICFDLMFQIPAVQVLQKYNIRNVVFTTMWFSEMPYLTAVQIQQGYAYHFDINFIASGANNPRVGSAGSGIYSGKAGALVSTMPGVGTTRLLVARVPKSPGRITEMSQGPIYNPPTDQDTLILISDPSFPSHLTRQLVPGSQQFSLNYNDVSCQFSVTMSQRGGPRQYNYRAAAFSGVRSFSGVETGGARICSVVACTGDTIDTCATRFPEYTEDSTAIFEELTIVATIPTPVFDVELQVDDSVVYPLALDVSIMPLNPEEFFYSVARQGANSVHTLTLNKRDAELYSFAIWGRVSASDGEEATPPLEEHEHETETPAVENTTENITENTPENTPENTSENTPENTTENTTENTPSVTPETDSSISHVLNSMLLLPVLALIKWIN